MHSKCLKIDMSWVCADVLDMDATLCFQILPCLCVVHYSIHCAKTAIDNSRRPPGVKRSFKFSIIRMFTNDFYFQLHG